MIIAWIICLVSITVSILVAISLLTATGKYKWKAASTDVPSVSICIPARNEAHALADCLERVLASDYEKLEILVLDDNSKDETSNLIKSFAHAGVRFIPGKALPDGWLGKNHALEQLAREASGDVIVFMDVDTKISVKTVSALVSAMDSGVQMAAVLPQRADIPRLSALLGHLRYFWELILPGVPSSSALWAIRREVILEKMNGFSPLATHAQPERELAIILQKTNGYKCLMDASGLGVYYEKRWASQRETSTRLLWPLFVSRISAGIIAFGCLIAWTASVISIGFYALWPQTLWLYIVTWAFGGVAYGLYLRRMWIRGWLLGALLWPVIVLQEMSFLLTSMYRYATKTVVWKGRSVTGATENQTYLTLDE